MKVAILSFYSGHIERGVEVWAEELKKSQEGKCEVKIFGNDKFPIDWTKPDLRGKAIRNFFLDYWSIAVLRFTLLALSDLRKYNADIIIPTNGGWQVLVIRIFTFFLRKKMIVVGHSGIGGDELWNLMCFPDTFVALSTLAAAWAKKKNPFLKIAHIPNGIWLSEFSDKGPKAKINLTRPIYLYAGAIEKGKRPMLAIEAVSQLNKGSLLMLGNGDKDVLQEVDALGDSLLGKRFRRKSVPHSEIAKYYRAADVFTLPTWSQEAFGIVYLEAMACGLPIVTTDDQIKREIIGEAGIFIDPHNNLEYSKALADAVSKNWGDIPFKQAEKFSWEIVSQKYFKLFNSIIK